MTIAALIPAILPVLQDVIGRIIPDPEQATKAQNELTVELLKKQQQLETAAAEIIRTEAASSHWLAANWRPLLMLTFGALIVARWFGWAAPNLSEAEYLALWNIVEIGLGGYVIGRSVEKVAPSIAESLKKDRGR